MKMSQLDITRGSFQSGSCENNCLLHVYIGLQYGYMCVELCITFVLDDNMRNKDVLAAVVAGAKGGTGHAPRAALSRVRHLVNNS